MEYLYEQQAMPSNATGVQVHLTAFDPNNNTEDLGYTTSDASGNYALMFTPPVPGVYKVTASFDGSNAYYGSSAEVAFGVSKAKSVAPSVTATPPSTTAPTNAPTQAPTQAPTVAPTLSPVVIPPTNAAPTATYIAIGLAVVIIVAAAAALVLRRRHN